MKSVFVFREVTDVNELDLFFRLRYNVFADGSLRAFIHPNEHRIDLDHYDTHSHHFGILTGTDPVGYFRLVLPKDRLYSPSVFKIGERYALFSPEKSVEGIDRAPFPFLSYRGVPDDNRKIYQQVLERGEQVMEASRLIILPPYRSVFASRFLIECALALHLRYSIGRKMHSIVSCYTKRKGFYERYGFCDFAPTYWLDGHSNSTLILPSTKFLRDSAIPIDRQASLIQFCEQFERNGYIQTSC